MPDLTAGPGGGDTLPPGPSSSPRRSAPGRWVRRVLVAAVALVVVPLLVVGTHVGVMSWGRGYDVDSVPERGVGMVLGAKAHPDGPSAFLAARLDLAVELYDAGRIRAILVTGDGLPRSNDEPAIMREYLEERGIPAGKIVEDPAGFDTYDSCVRARDVFGVSELTLITQDYHVNRAVTICRSAGIDAIAVGDTSMLGRFPYNWVRNWLREWPAKLKMEWDLLTARPPQQDPPTRELLDAVDTP